MKLNRFTITVIEREKEQHEATLNIEGDPDLLGRALTGLLQSDNRVRGIVISALYNACAGGLRIASYEDTSNQPIVENKEEAKKG
jgi:hypothetical protein